MLCAASTQVRIPGPGGIFEPISTPTDAPGAGTYGSTQSVTLSDATAVFILYTVDGSTPACPATGTKYTGAFNIAATTTLKAVGCIDASGGGVLTSVYTISGGALSGCSGPPTATGNSGCIKRETLGGATGCFSGFSSNCDNAWNYASGGTLFDYATAPAPLFGSYSLLISSAASNAYLDFTNAGATYLGAAVNTATLATGNSNYRIVLEATIDSNDCNVNVYTNGGTQLLQASASGGTGQTTAVTVSASTTYFIQAFYTPGTGANANCTAKFSTNGSSWGTTVSSTNGTGTANVAYVYLDHESTNQVYDDIRVSSATFNYW